MFEVFYTTARVARIDAPDRASAKRAFAAFVLYDDHAAVASDIEVSFGDDAELAPLDPPPVAGSREEMRAWFARSEAQSESFETGTYEDPERTLDAYLRLLATNDPWRLEGHGNRGRILSAVALPGQLTTFDGRVSYSFDAARFFDYLRLDLVVALDPARPQESVRIERLLAVSALADDGLRQIVSAYETIALQRRLTARFAVTNDERPTFQVMFHPAAWARYFAHRRGEPERFVPPPGWTSAYPDAPAP